MKLHVWFSLFKCSFVHMCVCSCMKACTCLDIQVEVRRQPWVSVNCHLVWGTLILNCVTCSTVAGLRVSGAFLLAVGVLEIWTHWLLYGIKVIRLAQQASSSLHSKRGACHYVMILFLMSLETSEPFRNSRNKTKWLSCYRMSPIPQGRHQFFTLKIDSHRKELNKTPTLCE